MHARVGLLSALFVYQRVLLYVHCEVKLGGRKQASRRRPRRNVLSVWRVHACERTDSLQRLAGTGTSTDRMRAAATRLLLYGTIFSDAAQLPFLSPGHDFKTAATGFVNT